MVIHTEDKVYQKLCKSGSILKGLRSSKGGGLGCIAGGITFIAFAVFILFLFFVIGFVRVGLFFLAILGIPGALLVLVGLLLRHKKNASYIAFYQKETGLREEELHQLDRELAAPDVHMIGYVREDSHNRQAIACFLTEHYFVTEGGYIRRLEDMVAVAYTVKTLTLGLLCLSRQDSAARFMTFDASADKKKGLCMEIIQALSLRNPQILRGQYLLCENKRYDLLSENDSREIIRLYLEGHKIEAAAS